METLLRPALFACTIAALSACSDSSDHSGDGRVTAHDPYSPASQQAAAIASGVISAAELLESYLHRIEVSNPSLNAIVALDIEAARRRAVEADEALARNESWGPLHGLPITIKDTLDVAGLPATYGNPAFADRVPGQNAAAVQRLLDAGAIVMGKTNTSLFAGDWQTYNDIYGTTNNPWALERTPGGSSGGSAAAVAAGLTSFGLGGDLAGSLRLPAHFSGVYSHKPSNGLVPLDGHFSRTVLPPAPEPPGNVFGVLGPVTRYVEDLELVFRVLAGAAAGDLPPARHLALPDFRVAAWLTDPALETDSEVLGVLEQLVTGLEAAGVTVDRLAPVDDLAAVAGDYRLLRLYATGRISLADTRLQQLLATREQVMQQVAAFFDGYDVLLAPAAAVVAFPHDQSPLPSRTLIINGAEVSYLAIDTWAALAQYANLPATTAPVGLSVSGLPVGVQIMGPGQGDFTTLAFATAMAGERLGGYTPPP